jgi:hypothetical protein
MIAARLAGRDAAEVTLALFHRHCRRHGEPVGHATFTTGVRMTATTSTRRRVLLDEWDDLRTELHAMERAALVYLDALDVVRRSSYSAVAVKRLDDHASDYAWRALDLLSDIVGDFQRRLDADNIDPDAVSYDDSVLQAEAMTWAKRAEARR